MVSAQVSNFLYKHLTIIIL